jgi:hypothetical protein
VQLAYEYGYGFDGGRRWRKDYLNGVWTRYPCGVACGAGELVEQTSDLSGSQWTTSALYLQGISLVRRNNEWHHFDPLGTAQVITNNSASVISNNVYDIFGVLRYEQGSAQTPWRWLSGRSKLIEETLVAPQAMRCMAAAPELPAVGVNVIAQQAKPPTAGQIAKCVRKCAGHEGHKFWWCLGDCLGRKAVAQYCRDIVCRVWPSICDPWRYPDNPCNHSKKRVDACQSCCEVDFYCCFLMGNTPAACYTQAQCCHLNCDLEFAL